MKQLPEMDPMLVMEQIARDVERHDRELIKLREYITGEDGDPRKGLLWLATMQQETINEMRKLVAASATALDAHKKEGHAPRLNTWQTLALDIAKNVSIWIIIALIGFLVIGIRVSVGGGRIVP